MCVCVIAVKNLDILFGPALTCAHRYTHTCRQTKALGNVRKHRSVRFMGRRKEPEVGCSVVLRVKVKHSRPHDFVSLPFTILGIEL